MIHDCKQIETYKFPTNAGFIFSPFTDLQDLTGDTQKKSKRKGRNKQEVITLSQNEPEAEAVKTPIDLMRVSTAWLKHLFFYQLFNGVNSCGFHTQQHTTVVLKSLASSIYFL